MQLGKITKAEIKNFRSITNLAIDFPAGLIIFTGHNGAGKSSIIFAIQYALFGRAGGLAKKALSSLLTGESPDITVSFDSGIKIRRADKLYLYQNGSWYSVREPHTFAASLAHYKFSFINSGYQPFLDMSPSSRREYLVNFIKDYKIITQLVPKIATMRNRLVSFATSVKEKSNYIQGVMDNTRHMISETKQSLSNAKQRIENTKKELESYKEKIKTVKKPEDPKELKGKVAELMKEYDVLVAEREGYNKALRKIQQIKSAISMLESKIINCKADLERLNKSIEVKKCEWCGSKLSVASVEKLSEQEAKIKKDLELYNKQLESYKKSLAEYAKKTKNKRDFDSEISTIKRDIKDLNELIMEAEHELTRYNAVFDAVGKLEAIIATQEKEARRLEDNLKSLERAYKENKLTKERYERVYRVISGKIEDFSSMAEFVRKGFLDYGVESLCSHITEFANKLLTCQNFTVDIFPDGGKIEIEISGRSPATLSAGERQRVRIAIEVAFSMFSENNEFLFIDELLDSNLDKSGLEFLANVVTDYLLPKFQQVCLVSHIDDLKYMLPSTTVYELQNVNGETRCIRQ